MTEPLVTVVVSSYNRPRLIRDALDSVLAQTWPNVQLLIADDWSDQPVRQVVTEWGLGCRADRFRDRLADGAPRMLVKCPDAKPTLYERQFGQRTSVCINAAIPYARGDFICFLPDDDFLTPRSIEVRARYLIDHPDVNCVYGRLEACKGTPPTPGIHWLGDGVEMKGRKYGVHIDFTAGAGFYNSDGVLIASGCLHDRMSFYSAEPIARAANKVDHGMMMVRRTPYIPRHYQLNYATPLLPEWPEERTCEIRGCSECQDGLGEVLYSDCDPRDGQLGEHFDCPDAGWFYRLELSDFGPFHSVPDFVVVKRYHQHGHRTAPIIRE